MANNNPGEDVLWNSAQPGRRTAVRRNFAKLTLATMIAGLLLVSAAIVFDGESQNQGCVNQGEDRRVAAPVVCWAQRHLSWKSETRPRFLLIGKPQGAHMGIAWPPYLVFNRPDRTGGWHMFRIGFRYDRNWRGYIFPTLALKRVSEPLRY